jgi:hypothetical protein
MPYKPSISHNYYVYSIVHKEHTSDNEINIHKQTFKRIILTWNTTQLKYVSLYTRIIINVSNNTNIDWLENNNKLLHIGSCE